MLVLTLQMVMHLWYKNTKNADGTFDRATTSTHTRQAQPELLSVALCLNGLAVLTNTFSYKGFELCVFLSARCTFGNKLNWYGVGRYSSANGRYEDNQTVDQIELLGQNRDIPIPIFQKHVCSTTMVLSLPVALFRMVLLYVCATQLCPTTSPNHLLARLNPKPAGICNGTKPAYLDQLHRLDPEVNADDIVTNIAQGYDFYTAPQPRTILAGFNIGF